MRRDPRSIQLVAPASVPEALAAHGADAAYLGGGTTLVDLQQLGHDVPRTYVHLGRLGGDHTALRVTDAAVVLGAGLRMADVAVHPEVVARHPALAASLQQAASPQIRQMATLGGNVLQRTRCPYFREPHGPCNKRDPGSGCGASGGDTRGLAVLGTSEACLANYAGDFAVALVALQARVRFETPDGETHEIAARDLHRLPGDTPHRETTLPQGALLTAFVVPHTAGRSVYVKARDRASYAFALASCAAVVGVVDGRVVEASLALGGLATVPWPADEAATSLMGKTLGDDAIERAARLAVPDVETDAPRAFKVDLGRRVVRKALLSLR
jgi:xanthine dehydrogenase YagS FAD-binding subunit